MAYDNTYSQVRTVIFNTAIMHDSSVQCSIVQELHFNASVPYRDMLFFWLVCHLATHEIVIPRNHHRWLRGEEKMEGGRERDGEGGRGKEGEREEE